MEDGRGRGRETGREEIEREKGLLIKGRQGVQVGKIRRKGGRKGKEGRIAEKEERKAEREREW